MTPYSSIITRKAEARREKVLEILKAGPKTAIQISTALRDCRYEDYSFWAPGDIHSILPKMLKTGQVQKVGSRLGKTIYGLIRVQSKEGG